MDFFILCDKYKRLALIPTIGYNNIIKIRSAEVVIMDNNIGTVQIADDVVAIIAALAATEVQGVASMAGNITKEIVSKLGVKNLSKGVRVTVEEGSVCVDVAINVEYGYAVTDVSYKVQDRVKTAVENMTGLNVTEVNVKIAGVTLEK